MDQSFDAQWLRQIDTTDNERIRDWAVTSKNLQRLPPAYQSSRYESLSMAIEDDVDLIEEAMYRIARNRAIMTRARGLPFDVLIIIVGFLGPFRFPEQDEVTQLLALASVCRTWRQCILGTPSFWSRFFVGERDGADLIWEMRELWQERAGSSCPLHVLINDSLHTPTVYQEWLKSNASRIVSLQVRTHPYPDSTHQFTRELMVEAANSIVELAFVGNKVPKFNRDFKVTLPKLKYLNALPIFPSFDIQASSLREIVILPLFKSRCLLPKTFLDILSGMSSQVMSIILQGVDVVAEPKLPTADFTLPNLITLQWTDVTNQSRHEIPLYLLFHSNNLTTLHIGLSFLAKPLPRCQSLTFLTLANEDISDAVSPLDIEQAIANFENLPSLKFIQVPIFNQNSLLQRLARYIVAFFATGLVHKHCHSLDELRCDCEPYPLRDKRDKIKDGDNGRKLLDAVGVAITTKSIKRKEGQPMVTFKHAGSQSPWDEITHQTLSLAQFRAVFEQLPDEKGRKRRFNVQFSK